MGDIGRSLRHVAGDQFANRAKARGGLRFPISSRQCERPIQRLRPQWNSTTLRMPIASENFPKGADIETALRERRRAPETFACKMQFKENSCLSFKPLGMQADSR